MKLGGQIKSDKIINYLLVIYTMSAIVISYTPWGANVSQGIGVVLAVVFLIRHLMRRIPLIVPPALVAFMAFFAYSLLGGFWARESSEFIRLEFTLLQLIILVAIVCSALSYRSDINLIAKAFVVATFISAILEIAGIDLSPTRRAASLLVNANLYGLALLFATIFSVYLFRESSKRWQKLFYLLAIILFVSQIPITGSRKAVFGLITVVIMLFLLYARRHFTRQPIRLMIAIIVLASIVTGYLLYLPYTPFYKHMILVDLLSLGTIERIREASLQERTLLILTGIQVWQDQPIFGVGTNQFQFYTGYYTPGLRQTYTHSNYIELLANFGLIGFALYYSIYVLILRRVFILYKTPMEEQEANLRDILLIIMVLLILLELSWVTYYEKVVWLYLSIVIAASRALMSQLPKANAV